MLDLKRNMHSVYSLSYHLVLTTKYRHPCITKPMQDRIEVITGRCLISGGAS